MNVSRRRYMGAKGGSIPYQRIEYLESKGTQNINLPLSVSAGDFFEISGEICPMASTAVRGYMVLAAPSKNFFIQQYSISTAWTYATSISGNAANGGMDFALNTFTTFALSTEGKTINGSFYSLARPIISGKTFTSIIIFGTDMVKVRWIKVKIRSEIAYDLIPVRVGQVGYLYDKLSGELFGNAGSGKFTLGPDIN